MLNAEEGRWTPDCGDLSHPNLHPPPHLQHAGLIDPEIDSKRPLVLCNLFVLLHMIRKTSAAVPESDIETAKQRWRDFKDRMDANKRVPPRAAGSDAP